MALGTASGQAVAVCGARERAATDDIENFSRTTTNRLNRTHRPNYLLSGMLECAECGGSYAIMAKERYGCSNHKSKLPVDGLGGACCSNQKTILRKNLEDGVLSCLPAAFFGIGLFGDVAGQARQNLAASIRNEPMEKQFEALARHDYLEKLRAGELDTGHKKKKLLDAYAEELSVKRLEWQNIQVSVVAGAGFEPAAFRL